MRRLRLTRKGWAAPLAALVAIGIIVALAFYVRGFESTSNDPVALPTDSPAAGAPHGSSAPSKNAHGTQVVVPGGGTATLGAGGSGLSLRGVHTLVAHVESSEPIGDIGYLAPTSPDLSFGTAKNVGKSWTVRTRVTGRPKYAIIWIKGAKDGTSVSCSITIDGKVADRQRTKGPYGRQICFG
jgi:hypothetical protein